MTLIAITVIACEKEADLTDAENALVGDWTLNTTETYTNGVLSQTIPHTDPTNCHLELKSTEHKDQEGSLNCENGLSCQPHNNWWQLEGAVLQVGSNPYTIVTQSSSTLILQLGDPASSSGSYKHYLTK